MSFYSSLLKRKYWIFDLDGTLTVAVHDFDAIREELGIQGGLPIIETINSLPKTESILLKTKLQKIEEKLAHGASPALGVETLLEKLSKANCNFGILTLNSKENAWYTLKAIGLEHYFSEEFVIGRWCEEPKPSPKGIHKMLYQWNVKANEALMVGDFLYDLQVGRAAKTATIHVDPRGEFSWPELADIKVQSLEELSKMLLK